MAKYPYPYLLSDTVKDVKTGKVKIDHAPDVSNRAEGVVTLISEELGATRFVTSSVDTPITSGLVKSRVISSPLTSYQSRRPPPPFLLSSTSSLFRPTIVLDEIPIPAWPSHYSEIFR